MSRPIPLRYRRPWRSQQINELSALAAAALITSTTGVLAWGTPLRDAHHETVWAVVLLPGGDAGEPVFLRTLGDCAPWFARARTPDDADPIQAQVRAVLDAAVHPSTPLEREADDAEPVAAPAE